MSNDSERQGFESAWDKRQRADWARGGRDPDQYPIEWGLAFKLTGWEMWQARAALSQQEPIAWVRMAELEQSLGAKIIKLSSGRVSLMELPPDAGDYPKEPEIQCGIFCEMAEREMTND